MLTHSNGGPRPQRVVSDNRRITKDAGAQNMFTRSFITSPSAASHGIRATHGGRPYLFPLSDKYIFSLFPTTQCMTPPPTTYCPTHRNA